MSLRGSKVFKGPGMSLLRSRKGPGMSLHQPMLQVHRVEDGTLVIGSSPARSSPPAVKISPSASMKRQAKLKALADELTVLSQEDVVDTALIKPASVKNGTSTKVADTK